MRILNLYAGVGGKEIQISKQEFENIKKQLSKSKQLAKVKKDNPMKMSKKDYKAKCDWLKENYPKCQICFCNKSDDIHHTIYGAGGRDDRSVIAICRTCHHEIHHGNGVALHRRDIEQIGLDNHMHFLKEVKC